MKCVLWMRTGEREKGNALWALDIWGSSQEFNRLVCGVILSNLKLFALYCELFMCTNTSVGALLLVEHMIPVQIKDHSEEAWTNERYH